MCRACGAGSAELNPNSEWFENYSLCHRCHKAPGGQPVSSLAEQQQQLEKFTSCKSDVSRAPWSQSRPRAQEKLAPFAVIPWRSIPDSCGSAVHPTLAPSLLSGIIHPHLCLPHGITSPCDLHINSSRVFPLLCAQLRR